MITRGHIDIESFGDFYTQVNYERPKDATKGLNYCNILDSERYKPEFIKTCIHRGIRTDVEHYLVKNFNWLCHHAFALHLMEPGMILPLHDDKYNYYMKANNVPDINDISRVIIFLQDWKKGHISQVGDNLTPQWKTGDWVCWAGSTDHLAANLGHENRYVLQITGTKK